MIANSLRLAWQFYRQEKLQTQQKLLRYTQAILMTFIVCLSQTSDTIQSYLQGNLASMLGADIVLIQNGALSTQQTAYLQTETEQLTTTQVIESTLTRGQNWQRAKIKAVAEGYPLQGELKVSDSLGGKSYSQNTGPNSGEIWLDSRLFAGLGVDIGDTLFIAKHTWRVSKILTHEPDRLMEGHSVDMRAMIHLSDVYKLGVPEDAMQQRTLMNASSKQTSKVLDWQKANLPAAEVYHKQGAHPLALFWKRTENFIGLASVLLFFMAVIAIEQLSHVYSQKEQFTAAVCMSLGATKTTGILVSVIKWGISILFLLPLVLAIAAISHWFLVDWLSNTFPQISWQWNTLLSIKTLTALVLVFVVFQLPVWYAIAQSSVIKLAGNRFNALNKKLVLGCAVIALSIVALVYSDNPLLTTMLLISMAICIALILAMSWLALTLGEALTKRWSGLIPFAMYMMKQRLVTKSTQILGAGLCAFLLLFTLMLLRDLSNTMASYSRQHNGNLLVSQATQEQMDHISVLSKQHGFPIRQQKSFVYGKLSHVNGLQLDEFNPTPSESKATLKREIRIHWSENVPANNRLVEGSWWTDNHNDWQQISVEQEVMTDMGLDLGDTVTLHLAGQAADFTIVASHVFKSGAGSITFWMQIPPAAIQHTSARHYAMANIELADDQLPLLAQLWQQYPSLRMISLSELTAHFDSTLDMITQAISGFALIIILLAIIVVLASTHSLERKEQKKNCIIMSFGFSKRTCLQLIVIEWIVTGLIAAIGAVAGAYIAGLLIYQSQFSLVYQPSPLWILGAITLIVGGFCAIGVATSQRSLSGSVRTLMAEQ